MTGVFWLLSLSMTHNLRDGCKEIAGLALLRLMLLSWHKTADLSAVIEAHLAGLLQVLLEAFTSALHPGLCARYSDSLDGGILDLSHALHIAQANGFSVFLCKFCEGTGKAIGKTIHRGRHGFFVRQFFGQFFRFRMSAALMIDQGVARNAIQPGPRIIQFTEYGTLRERLEKGFLQQVLCEIGVAQPSDQETPQFAFELSPRIQYAVHDAVLIIGGLAMSA